MARTIALLGELSRLRPDDCLLGLQFAFLLLYCGDRDRDRRQCARMADRFGSTDSLVDAGNVALALTAGSELVADRGPAFRLARQAVESEPGAPFWRRALAGAYLQAG